MDADERQAAVQKLQVGSDLSGLVQHAHLETHGVDADDSKFTPCSQAGIAQLQQELAQLERKQLLRQANLVPTRPSSSYSLPGSAATVGSLCIYLGPLCSRPTAIEEHWPAAAVWGTCSAKAA